MHNKTLLSLNKKHNESGRESLYMYQQNHISLMIKQEKYGGWQRTECKVIPYSILHECRLSRCHIWWVFFAPIDRMLFAVRLLTSRGRLVPFLFARPVSLHVSPIDSGFLFFCALIFTLSIAATRVAEANIAACSESDSIKVAVISFTGRGPIARNLLHSVKIGVWRE